MKRIIFILAVLLTSNGFCQWKEYDVIFQNHKNYFEFFVTTLETQTSMGSLVMYDLHITLGEGCVPGVIKMSIHMDPNAASLPALGYRKGHFIFTKGEYLPDIPNGTYEVIINEVSYGQMYIDSDQGSYHPLEAFLHD